MFSKFEHTIEVVTKCFDFSGIGELLIVRWGSNFASLLQVVNTVALNFSSDNLSFLDSSQSCKIFR